MRSFLKHLSTPMIVGVNVALATLASATVAALGHPNVAWPICSMVAAVHGASTIMSHLQKAAPTNENR